MSIKKNAISRVLLVVSVTVLLLYSLSYVPPVQQLYARALRIKTPYVPYVAPDSAFFKGYERMDEPYMQGFGSESDIIVEEHKIDIDPETNTYRNSTKGYVRMKDKDGGYTDFPAEVQEEYNYDTSWKHTPGHKRVPLAATPRPEVKPAPDSVHLAGDAEKAKMQALMKKLRKVELPYVYAPDSLHSITVISRKVFTKQRHDSIFLCTELGCMAPNPANKQLQIPVTMTAEEHME